MAQVVSEAQAKIEVEDLIERFKLRKYVVEGQLKKPSFGAELSVYDVFVQSIMEGDIVIDSEGITMNIRYPAEDLGSIKSPKQIFFANRQSVGVALAKRKKEEKEFNELPDFIKTAFMHAKDFSVTAYNVLDESDKTVFACIGFFYYV